MSNDTPLRIAIIGAGAIAQTHALAMRRSSSVRMVAVCDVNQQAAQSLAEPFHAMTCQSLDQLLANDGFDAAIVCTPPDSHPEIGVELLEAGKHVLCEKPLAITTDLAQKMFHAAEVSSAKLTMASKFRHVEDVRTAKSIVDSGLLGEIVLFENVFAASVDMRRRWNSQAEISGGGVLIDNGTHSVDIMRYFLGPLADLQCLEGRRLQGLNVEETVKIFVRSQSGVLGDIDLSWSIHKELPHYISLYGSDGTLHIGWKQSHYRRHQDREATVFGNGYDKVQAFADQLENFVAWIRGEAEPVVNMADAMASVAVVETAYRALRDTAWHTVEEPALPAESDWMKLKH